MKSTMANLQSLGRALMLPIAVLPAAGLLLRLGQPDLLDIEFVAASGNALFANLGLLFAIGVAVGFAREGHGAAGLSGAVCFLVATFGAKVFVDIPPSAFQDVPDHLQSLFAADHRDKVMARLSVPMGILSGIIAGILYNRYATIRLPEYLAFFGGKRFVPIASACAGIVLATAFGLGAEVLNAGIAWAGDKVLGAGSAGLFIYGVLNRLLIVTGLHHILNNAAWFVIGDYNGATGDLNRFFAGDPEAGSFMAGFFPIMMFGLPAACFAMYRAALPERRKEVGGMLGSMALTSFLTGVTEPVEFTFMFLAPVLYAIHAILTGLSMALMDILNVKLGFGFSAGLFDYVINFNASTNPILLIPIGGVYALVYYLVFSFAIRTFDLKTPGREIDQASSQMGPADKGPNEEALAYVSALGGQPNIEAISACTTRLRLTIGEPDKINEAELRKWGAKGFVRPSANTLQIVIGPRAELLLDAIEARLKSDQIQKVEDHNDMPPLKTVSPKIIQALGGKENVREAKIGSQNRLLVELVDPSAVDYNWLTESDVYLFASNSEREGVLHFWAKRKSLLLDS